ncbi:MAG: polyprenyl synthetase family protein [Planctomycetales bacterium]|nr:polyprenyl synthetase family protein [Planctomycetales bacterium]
MDDLQQVEAVLSRELRNDSQFVDELLRYGGQLGGKRLRPALLLLTARAVGQVRPEHYTLAAVVEMIHTATLVHDDVLDEAEMRRHLATINARWNNETSVLLGDYLFSHAFYLASTTGSTYACSTIGRSTNLVCAGELRQVGNRGNHGLTEDEYYRIIDGKTAELCACACHLGAKYAADDEAWIEPLEQYGRSLGMAFQIADDLLDLLGDEATTGKSLGTDLEKQKPTLPIIHCYQQATEAERSELVALLESPDVTTREQLQSWFSRFDALNYARRTAHRFAGEARQQLAGLPDSIAKNSLLELADFVIGRSL